MSFSIDNKQLIEALVEKSWFIPDQFLPIEITQELLKMLRQLYADENFKKAGIGRGLEQKIAPQIRKSEIFWINDWTTSPALIQYSNFLSELMIYLNQNLFLSLKRYESQFAHYSPGGFYKKHIDQHKKTQHRKISVILYLNQVKAGGELILYKKGNRNTVEAKIIPEPGKLVFLVSKDIFHEVLSCESERCSLTTWMRDDELLPFVHQSS